MVSRPTGGRLHIDGAERVGGNPRRRTVLRPGENDIGKINAALPSEFLAREGHLFHQRRAGLCDPRAVEGVLHRTGVCAMPLASGLKRSDFLAAAEVEANKAGDATQNGEAGRPGPIVTRGYGPLDDGVLPSQWYGASDRMLHPWRETLAKKSHDTGSAACRSLTVGALQTRLPVDSIQDRGREVILRRIWTHAVDGKHDERGFPVEAGLYYVPQGPIDRPVAVEQRPVRYVALLTVLGRCRPEQVAATMCFSENGDKEVPVLTREKPSHQGALARGTRHSFGP